MPDYGLCEIKHVAECYVTFKCCVGRCVSFVRDIEKHNGMYRNKTKHINTCNIYTLTEKILSTPSFGGEVKPSVPRRRFTACKRSLNLRGSLNLGKIIGNFLAHSSTFRC